MFGVICFAFIKESVLYINKEEMYIFKSKWITTVFEIKINLLIAKNYTDNCIEIIDRSI